MSWNLTCQKWGFPKSTEINWPKCIDPTLTTTTTPAPPYVPPCQCLGDPGVDNEKLLDAFCRDPQVAGNTFHFSGFTPPSKRRCGNRSPEKPTLENHCFCSRVETQASKFLVDFC